MKKGIAFEFSTTDFDHAIRVSELAFGYEGQEWERVKKSNSLEYLIEFLESDGMEYQTFLLIN